MSYVLISDIHHHGWSQFGTINSDGINSRNQIIIKATEEAVETGRVMGCSTLVVAGDVFHTRGNISPNVLNPVIDLYRRICKIVGMQVLMIPGNHDLASKDSDRVSSAITALEEVGVTVVHRLETFEIDGVRVSLIPWMSDLNALREAIPARLASDVIIHAPLNGVIEGLPDHGLTPDELLGCGFRNVFVGHYHNHKFWQEGKRHVASIGALTHQTWNDVGSRAGFVIVNDGGSFTHHETKAPKFVDYTFGEMDESELVELVSGNYVRVKMEVSSEAETKEIRGALSEFGALGVVIHPIKASKLTARTTGTVSGISLKHSVKDYLVAKKATENVEKLCMDIIDEVETVE